MTESENRTGQIGNDCVVLFPVLYFLYNCINLNNSLTEAQPLAAFILMKKQK